MREIKFRTWTGRNGPTSEVRGGKMEYFDVRSLLIAIATVGRGYRIWPNEDDVLMQFTGLKDKNGEEIYEGDILLEHISGMASGRPFAVEWISGEAENFACTGFSIDAPNQFHSYEVIGNIYENQNLLDKGEA